MIDFLGNRITEGARIVYPQRGGSMLWLVEARVVEVGPDYLKVNRIREGDRYPARPSATIYLADRTVVVPDRTDS